MALMRHAMLRLTAQPYTARRKQLPKPHATAPWAKAARAAAAAAATASCLLPTLAQAHGALLEQRTVPAIAVRAMYDTGEPMKTAQITVYAPNDPAKPWLTGKADPEGHFRFVPDPAIPGQWTIQAREAGHGALIYVTLGSEQAAPAADATVAAADTTTTATANSGASASPHAPAVSTASTTVRPGTSASAHSPLQRWVMVACVVWGFIGTALFFTRKPRSTS